MPELRKDPIVGRWVIIATERARRPGNFVEKQGGLVDINDDYFDHKLGQEVAVFEANDVRPVRIVQHANPILSNGAVLSKESKGIYETLNNYGSHEVVLETDEKIHNMADLSSSQIKSAIHAYALRLNELRSNEKIKYAYVYKNYISALSEGRHSSSSQIIASAVMPVHLRQKLLRSKSYYALNRRNIYQDLIDEEIKDEKRIVFENDEFIAFMPFASRFVFEVSILPKNMHHDFAIGIEGKEEQLADCLKSLLSKFKEGLDDPSYTFVINSSPFPHEEDDDGQWKTIDRDFCWHIELTPRLTYVAGFEIGTGFHICSIPPEETASYLKGVKI